MSSPLPGKLILLDQLREEEPGTKVRFLGCVCNDYCASSGYLPLQCPTLSTSTSQSSRSTRPSNGSSSVSGQPAHPVTILLDISHVDPIQAGQDVLCVGTWLNVVGYVVPKNDAKPPEPSSVVVQAAMIWEAIGVDPGSWEKAVISRQKAAQALRGIKMDYRQ